jgi:hypothetical protein
MEVEAKGGAQRRRMKDNRVDAKIWILVHSTKQQLLL